MASKVVKEVEKVEKVVKSDVVTVVWNGGSRVYSAKVHGEDFAKLAKEFADKDSRRSIV